MLVPVPRLGRIICRESMLPAKLIRPVALVSSLTLTVFRLVFSVMSKVPTVLREIPSKLVRPVLVMVTLPASETPLVKSRDCSSGRAVQEMEPTLVRLVKLRVVRVVRPSSLKVSPMELREEELKEVMLLPPVQLSPPVMEVTPLRVRSPEALSLISTSPLRVVQVA